MTLPTMSVDAPGGRAEVRWRYRMDRIVIDQELCKGCQLCAVVCPPGVLAFSIGLNSRGYHAAVLADDERCTSCTACALVCPDVAITVYRPERGEAGAAR